MNFHKNNENNCTTRRDRSMLGNLVELAKSEVFNKKFGKFDLFMGLKPPQRRYYEGMRKPNQRKRRLMERRTGRR